MSWIDITQYLTSDFLDRPRSITITAPNGVGKTTSICRFVSRIQTLNSFERIFIVVSSHEIGNKIEQQLQYFGAERIVRYVGIDKCCINKKLLNRVVSLGLPHSLACRFCEFNIFNIYQIYDRNQQLMFALRFIEDMFKNNHKVVNPLKIRLFNWKTFCQICIQPLIKKITISPQIDNKIKNTIIFITPYSLFSSKPIIVSWRQFFKRQRVKRKYLAVFDECDNIIYSGFQYKLSKPDFTTFDINILNKLSSKTRKLIKYVEFYNKLYEILYKTAEGYIYPEDCVKIVIQLFDKYYSIIRKIESKIFEIAREAFENNERTFIVNSISEIYCIEYFTETMARTIEVDNDTLIIQDLDYAYRILYDTEYPFRYFWKLSTTATFPSYEIFYESKLINKGKRCIEYVETIDIYPENVYILIFNLFPELFASNLIVSRNELINRKLDKIIQLIKKSILKYKELFNTFPKGLILFTGNKKQFSILKDCFSNMITKDLEGLFIVDLKKTLLYVTYCASKYARGIDFENLDISIVVAPLLRPPRNNFELDPLDVARASAETIQSLFRIVRSLKPTRPKIIGLEGTIIFKKTYMKSFPSWFNKLVEDCITNNKIIQVKI
jgi:superfamily II DNA or RNA helicase